MKKTGKTYECSQLAYEYYFTDINGSRHYSVESFYGYFKYAMRKVSRFFQKKNK